MKRTKKLGAWILSLALFASSIGIFTASAETTGTAALYSQGSVNFAGSGIVKGDAIVTAGQVTGAYNAYVTGKMYVADGVMVGGLSEVNDPLVAPYTGAVKNYTFKPYAAAPETSYFLDKNTEYSDGSKNLVIGWGGNDKPSGYALTADSYINKLEIGYGLTLNIDVPQGQVRVICVETLGGIQGANLVIRGGGRVVMYARHAGNLGNTVINKNGDPQAFTLLLETAGGSSFNSVDVTGNLIVQGGDASFMNLTLQGNIYAAGNVALTDDKTVTGLVYAPQGKLTINGSVAVKGYAVTAGFEAVGAARIEQGAYSGLASDVAERIGDGNDKQMNGGSGEGGGGENPGDQDKMVEITVVVARRMSVRLEDGTILKNGEKFTMPEGGTVRFQLCTNNWDTDTYTDDGQGIAGTKVFEYTHVKNKEKFLRVDTDSYFVPVIFHFAKGDYQKLTGVDQVLSTPLESLSVNFPLGATIQVKAYVRNRVVETNDLFVQANAKQGTVNIQKHTWNY